MRRKEKEKRREREEDRVGNINEMYSKLSQYLETKIGCSLYDNLIQNKLK